MIVDHVRLHAWSVTPSAKGFADRKFSWVDDHMDHGLDCTQSIT
jgi:hypothetical protein